MEKLLDKLLQAKVHMLLIVGGFGLLFFGLFEGMDEGIKKQLTTVDIVSIGIGGMLLITGLFFYIKNPVDKAAFHKLAEGKSASEILDLQGKAIVFTGTFNLERHVLKRQASRLGATVVNQVTTRTDYLIVGTKPGANKVKAAGSCNVPIIQAEQWYATMNKLSR